MLLEILMSYLVFSCLCGVSACVYFGNRSKEKTMSFFSPRLKGWHCIHARTSISRCRLSIAAYCITTLFDVSLLDGAVVWFCLHYKWNSPHTHTPQSKAKLLLSYYLNIRQLNSRSLIVLTFFLFHYISLRIQQK